MKLHSLYNIYNPLQSNAPFKEAAFVRPTYNITDYTKFEAMCTDYYLGK